MSSVRKPATKKTIAKVLIAKETVSQDTQPVNALCPLASSTSDINYYGANSKSRNAAYARVMAFVEESKKKNAGG